jgi:hypothetical protein
VNQAHGAEGRRTKMTTAEFETLLMDVIGNDVDEKEEVVQVGDEEIQIKVEKVNRLTVVSILED